jgi:hypothetical protein
VLTTLRRDGTPEYHGPGAKISRYVVVLGLVVVAVVAWSHAASADSLCLDRSGDFVTCPATQAPQPAGVTTVPTSVPSSPSPPSSSSPSSPSSSSQSPPPSAVAGDRRGPASQASAVTKAPRRSGSDWTSTFMVEWLGALIVMLLVVLGVVRRPRRLLRTAETAPLDIRLLLPNRLRQHSRSRSATSSETVRSVVVESEETEPETAESEPEEGESEEAVSGEAVSDGARPEVPASLAAQPEEVIGASEHWLPEVFGAPSARRTSGAPETPTSQLAGELRLYCIAVDSLATLATQLGASDADDTDLVLVVPVGKATLMGEPDELVEATMRMGGVCLAACSMPLASPAVAQRIERAVADASGSAIARCHPHPYAFVGPAGPIRSLLADLVEWGTDADRLTEVVLAGRHDVVVDSGSQLFHVLDGTGTDVVWDEGRAYARDEKPLVLIDARRDAIEPPEPPRLRVHHIATESLAQLASELGTVGIDDLDVVVVVPNGNAVVVADPSQLVEAVRQCGGICIAASCVPLASTVMAQRIEQAVAEVTGGAVLRCHPYPYGLVGPAAMLRSMLAGLTEGEGDADWLTEAVLSGHHDIVLDSGSQLIHVLDGTGMDVVMAGGRAYAGDQQPLVLIDPDPEGRALAFLGLH